MRTNSFFWRALDAARRANLADAGEAPPIAGMPGLTRRRMLGAMAAGSAALPLAACSALPEAPEQAKVAIVGGGLAGMEALRRLRDAKVDARLYEARGRIGGRIFTSHSGPVPADDGGQFINTDHEDVLALSRKYGLKLIDRDKMTGRSLAVADGRVITEAELAEDLRGIAARIAADAEALDADFEAHAPALDALSVTQYLDRHADVLTKPHVRKLLEATIRTEFGQEPGDASALALIFNLPVADGQHVEIISTSDERFVLEGGSGSLIAAMAPELTPYIETGHTLASVRRSAKGVQLRFTNGAVVEAERAVITVPAPLMRTIDFGGLLPPLWRDYVAEIDCGRNEKINAAYHNRPWEKTMGRSGDVWPLPGGFSEVWDATTVGGDIGLLTWFMGGAQCAAAARQDAGALRAAFEEQASPALPGIGEASAGWQRRTRWTDDPFARGAYSCFRPGQLTRFASLFWLEEDGRATQAAVAGPLIFAGEHLSDAWPGYMNGAAQTGRLAAEAVLSGTIAPARTEPAKEPA